MEAQFFFWLHIEGQMTIVREDRGQQGKRTIGHSHNLIRHWSRPTRVKQKIETALLLTLMWDLQTNPGLSLHDLLSTVPAVNE